MAEKVPELVDRKKGEKFVGLIKEQFEKSGVSVDKKTIEKALDEAHGHMVGCDQCATGWRW